MGNESSTAAPASAASLTANTPNIITKTSTPSILSTVSTTPVATMTTTTATAATATTTTTPTTTTTANTTATTTTTRSPTPTIISAASVPKDTPITPGASIESTSTPTFYSLVKSLTSESGKSKSASSVYSHWYKWSKFEKQKRDKGKILWYMSPPVTTTITSSPTTPTVTMTTAKIDDDRKEISDPSDIIAVPSFPLRSTAVYSPPHGDRIPSGRNELINTDTSIFKYYLPENRSKRTAGIHTKATMYKMNTFSRQIPLSAYPSQLSASNTSTNPTRNSASLPTFVSRGLQSNLEAQPIDSSSTQMRYYERQPSQLVAVTGVSNYRPSNVGLYHLSSKDTTSQPILPSLEKPPVLLNDQLRSPTTQSFPPPHPPPPLPLPPPRPSILKNSSMVLSQDMSNPLSEQTNNKVLEELRKRNKNTKDGVYRVKKVHLLEKNDLEPHPPPVLFTRPSRPPSSKASQSILRSEKLLFSDLFNRKK